jgi:hypothetical protein
MNNRPLIVFGYFLGVSERRLTALRLRDSSGSRYWSVVSMSPVSHQFLDGDDIGAGFEQPRGVGVTELVQRCVWDVCRFGDGF